MAFVQKFIPGNDTNNSLYKAIYSSDLEKITEIVDSVGLSYCPRWENGFDLLLTALECRHTDVAKFLLKKGCALEGGNTGKSKENKSITHLAVKQGDKELVSLFLDQDKNLLTKVVQGDSLLHTAIVENRRDIVEILLDQGADVECRNGGGMTPLHLATLRGNVETLEQLLAAGADIESKDSNGKTSLFLAASSGNVSVVKRLLELGANCKCESNNGQTPLLDATNKGYVAVVKDLIKFGAELSDKNGFGQTPLHIACMQKNKTLICTLLEAGADVNALDNNGMVPSDAVVKKFHSVESVYFDNYFVPYVMGKHLTKLKVGGFCLNRKNQMFYDMFCKIYCKEIVMGNAVVSAPSDVLQSVIETCEEQIKLMKYTKIDSGASMYDVFQKLKDPYSIVTIREREFLLSLNMKANFSQYEGIVQNLLKISKVRNDLLDESQVWFSSLVCSSQNNLPRLPEEMRIQILSYLSNEDLKQFLHSIRGI